MIRQGREMRSNDHGDSPVLAMNGHNSGECWHRLTFQSIGLIENNHSCHSLGTVVCVITGASRGFGKSLAWELCPRVTPGSGLLLVARTRQDLCALAEELTLQYPEIQVRVIEADLGTVNGVRRTVQAAQELNGLDAVQRVLIVNNAASLGDITKSFVNLTDLLEVDRYFSLNVSSALCLTSSLLKVFPGRPGLQRVVVNISSLCAVQPHKSCTLYCAGKAAREMLFRVLAEEEKDVRVLNYSPGPMDSTMQVQMRSHAADLEVRLYSINLQRSGQLLDCDVSAKKLLEILEKDDFKSGERMSFFD